MPSIIKPKRRIGSQPDRQQLPIASEQRGALGGWHVSQSLPSYLLRDCAHLTQQFLEILGPGLVIRLCQEGELAEVVDVAQCVAAGGVGAVARPAVMDADSAKAWQNADGIRRLRSALGVNGVVRQPSGAGHLHPGESPASAHAGLVVVQDRCPHERRLDRGIHWLQEACRLLHPADQRATSQPHALQVGQQLLCTAERNELRLHQILKFTRFGGQWTTRRRPVFQ
jgi:hypothetical protein